MTGDFDGAGDVTTGTMAARALEPRAGEDSHHAPTSANCLNCGTRLTGHFCHNCGQNGHVHRTIGAIGHDLLHGVLHLEGKTWRTLPMLAVKPGELTRRYIAGERARFVSPMAVFLFSVFLMFAVVAQLPVFNVAGKDFLSGVADGATPARTAVAEERAQIDAKLRDRRKQLAEARAKLPRDPERIAKLEARVADIAREGADLAKAEALLQGKSAVVVLGGQQSAAATSWLDAKVQHARENPKLLLYKIKTSAYKFSWALIPISLPFIWLMFPFRRDVGFYDHAIFATYSLAFMSLLVIVLAVAVAAGVPGGIAVAAAMIIMPVHIYKQLKYAYGLGRPGAVLRTALMLFFAIFTLTVFGLTLLGLGVTD